jgi:hypothetical protein
MGPTTATTSVSQGSMVVLQLLLQVGNLGLGLSQLLSCSSCSFTT